MTTSEDLRGILRRFPTQRILVLGDVILDRYWWGESSRLSPEAPVPVVRKQRSTLRPGGAANTAANLVALGATVELFGVTGADPEAAQLKASLTACGVSGESLSCDPQRPTTTKTRVIAMHQQLVRVDEEDARPIPEDIAAEAAEAAIGRLDSVTAEVISDYAKGFLTPPLLQSIIDAGRRRGLGIFVDPKGADVSRYRGCSVLKPNRLELGILTGLPVRNRAETAAAGCRLSAAAPGTGILVTEGPEGMAWFADGVERERAMIASRQVYDVTGAGDTVLATLAMAVSAGASIGGAMQLAAEAAAIAISQMGTTPASLKELEAAIAR